MRAASRRRRQAAVGRRMDSVRHRCRLDRQQPGRTRTAAMALAVLGISLAAFSAGSAPTLRAAESAPGKGIAAVLERASGAGSATLPEVRRRIRHLGIVIGTMRPGRLDAITDVKG